MCSLAFKIYVNNLCIVFLFYYFIHLEIFYFFPLLLAIPVEVPGIEYVFTSEFHILSYK